MKGYIVMNQHEAFEQFWKCLIRKQEELGELDNGMKLSVRSFKEQLKRAYFAGFLYREELRKRKMDLRDKRRG